MMGDDVSPTANGWSTPGVSLLLFSQQLQRIITLDRRGLGPCPETKHRSGLVLALRNGYRFNYYLRVET